MSFFKISRQSLPYFLDHVVIIDLLCIVAIIFTPSYVFGGELLIKFLYTIQLIFSSDQRIPSCTDVYVIDAHVIFPSRSVTVYELTLAVA